MTGVKNLSAALRRVAEEAVAQSARAACEQARALAPVDTGRLRGSISVRCDDLTARVAADCEYAAAVELGTVKRAARPFLVPAAQRERTELPRRARTCVRRAVRLSEKE